MMVSRGPVFKQDVSGISGVMPAREAALQTANEQSHSARYAGRTSQRPDSPHKSASVPCSERPARACHLTKMARGNSLRAVFEAAPRRVRP